MLLTPLILALVYALLSGLRNDVDGHYWNSEFRCISRGYCWRDVRELSQIFWLPQNHRPPLTFTSTISFQFKRYNFVLPLTLSTGYMANRSKRVPRAHSVLWRIPADPRPVFSSVQRDRRTTTTRSCASHCNPIKIR